MCRARGTSGGCLKYARLSIPFAERQLAGTPSNPEQAPPPSAELCNPPSAGGM